MGVGVGCELKGGGGWVGRERGLGFIQFERSVTLSHQLHNYEPRIRRLLHENPLKLLSVG